LWNGAPFRAGTSASNVDEAFDKPVLPPRLTLAFAARDFAGCDDHYPYSICVADHSKP